MLDALPLTVNGKLDTRALPAPEYQDGQRYRPPTNAARGDPGRHLRPRTRTPTRRHRRLVFELGGDSILSMQVVARARAARVLCRPKDLFIEQTVARLARVAGIVAGNRPDRRGHRPDAFRRLALHLSQQQLDELDQRYDIADILPLTPLQQGLLFHTQRERRGSC